MCTFLKEQIQPREELLQQHRDPPMLRRTVCLWFVHSSPKICIFQEVSASADQTLLRCFGGRSWQRSNSLPGLQLLGSTEQQLFGDAGRQDFAFLQVLWLAQSLPPQLILNLDRG